MKWNIPRNTITRRMWLFCLVGALFISSIAIPAAPAKAAGFQMKNGYYVGKGAAGKVFITGMGFQPNLVIVHSTAATGGVFKTSAMPVANTAFFGATADDATTQLTLNSDGFTVGTSLTQLNTQNTYYYWTAFGGSDCSSTGTFCVGTYTGNGVASRAITTGFQPRLVTNKRSTAVAGHFRTASMAANRTEYFTSTAADTAGALIASFSSTGFTVGATTDNVNTAVYNYFAFGGSTNFNEGTYTGDGTDNRSITGVGFSPDAVFVKNSTSATVNNRRSVYLTTAHQGDYNSYVSDAVANAVNGIQALEASGFQVGSLANTNESTFTLYWFAFGGEPAPQASGGTFTYQEGTYTGTGATLPVTGLGFKPDLVLIKPDTTGNFVMRTSMHQGDATSYVADATTTFTGGITSLDADGFTLGTSTVTNTTGTTYRWRAFGNAYNPYTQTGAQDFAVGAIMGNGLDNRNIVGLPFQPDFVMMRPNAAVVGAFRTSLHSGDASSYFGATADAANIIQAINADGFQLGTATNVNGLGVMQYWVAFKQGTNFKIGSFTGTGVDLRYVSMTSFHPDMVLLKASTAQAAIVRSATMVGDTTQFFTPTASTTNLIEQLNGGGFTLGTGTQANQNAITYKYLAWRKATPGTINTAIVDSGGVVVASPQVGFNAVTAGFACMQSTGVLGTTSQRIRISNLRVDAGWTTSIAAKDGPSAVWNNAGSTLTYDYNDPTSSGCADGGDADSVGGQLLVSPAVGTLTPQTSCSNTNLSLGANQAFSEGAVDTIMLATSAIGADTNCYWDITDIGLTQSIPAEKPADTYTINLTVTTVAS